MTGGARIVAGAGLLALGLALVVAGPARADLGPIELLSKDSAEQAEEALAPALSADGRFVAFQATIGGRKGIFRQDLGSRAMAPVVSGSADELGLGSDASAPSISADGRYVAFTTRAPLDEANDQDPQSPDVYVADMASSPPSYELASALDGSAQGLTYVGGGGSLASGGVALSADGRKVAFVTTAESDLTSGPGGSTEGEPTPAGQVLLRDLDADRTTLVSAVREAGGAMSDPARPVLGGAMVDRVQLPLLKGAALSADGTTVSWIGGHLPEQVPLLADEAAKITELDEPGHAGYGEPLWRRVADGPAAPTRRVVGGGDPLAPGCPGESGSLAEPSCQGPFPDILDKSEVLNAAMGWLGVPKIDGVPRLSADGRLVALIGNPAEATNVFLVDMSAGLSRRQALRQLTREVPVNPTDPAASVNQEPFVPLNGHVYGLALSADGQQIAFATARQRFPLAPPNLIGPAPVTIGLVELYLVDLELETLRRVTHGFGGAGEASRASQGTAAGGEGAASPSLDAGGHLIGFASTASNLIEGDGNQASDAFLVADHATAPASGPAAFSPRRGSRRPKRAWRLSLSAFSLPDGRVRLVAIVPGAGKLRARARGSLQADGPSRGLAQARRRARRGGKLKLTLELPRRLRPRAHSREGVYAIARVSFRHRGRKVLRQELQVRFRAHPKRRGGGR